MSGLEALTWFPNGINTSVLVLSESDYKDTLDGSIIYTSVETSGLSADTVSALTINASIDVTGSDSTLYNGLLVNAEIMGQEIDADIVNGLMVTVDATSVTGTSAPAGRGIQVTPISPGNLASWIGIEVSDADPKSAATGTVTSSGLIIGKIGQDSTGAIVNTRAIALTVPDSNPGTGLANNYGIYITGNGGTGLADNYTLYSLSTAKSLLNGPLTIIGHVQYDLNLGAVTPQHLNFAGTTFNYQYNGTSYILDSGPGLYGGAKDFNTSTATFRWWITNNVGNAGATVTPTSYMALRRQFGGQTLLVIGDSADFTNAFPALRRTGTALEVRLADDSGFAPFAAQNITANGTLTATGVTTTAGLTSTAAVSITGSTGATDNATLNVDAIVNTMVAAKLGTVAPVYAMNAGYLGFNLVRGAANFVFGKGSTAADYGGSLQFDTVNGNFMLGRTTAKGVAAATATPEFAASITGDGRLVLGPQVALTALYPALKRSATEMQVRLADDTDFAPLSAAIMSQATAFGAQIQIRSLTELTTIAAAATTSTTIQIPIEAVVFAVSARVTVSIPTATSFTYGVTGTPARYGPSCSVVAPSTFPGTVAGPLYYAAATPILITPNVTPGTNVGRVRFTIHYYVAVPATS